MPYNPNSAKRKSEYYLNILDADKIEHLNNIEEEIKRAKISGSLDANNELRNEQGYILSYEDPENLGMSQEKTFQYTRIEVKQTPFDRNKTLELEKEFTFFTQDKVYDIYPISTERTDNIENNKKVTESKKQRMENAKRAKTKDIVEKVAEDVQSNRDAEFEDLGIPTNKDRITAARDSAEEFEV